MKSLKSVMLITTLFCFLLIANTVVAETGVETDPEDDVIVYETVTTGEGSESDQYTTSDLPGADIVEVSYDRVDNSKTVTVMLKVNERGQVEETIDIQNLENESDILDLFSEPVPIAYSISLITDKTEYSIEYTYGNCTLNFGEEIDCTRDGNEFSATFELNSVNETIEKIGSQSMFWEMSLSGTNAGKSIVYLDAAPDTFLFSAEIDAPSSAITGESVEFTGYASNFADFLDMGVGAEYTYKWDFDNDGVTDKTGETVTYTYQFPGSYKVGLTVNDSKGTETTTSTTITVAEGDDTSSDGDGGDSGSGVNGGEATEDNPILIFIAIIGIIVVIGVVALVMVIRR